jgi:hypothetical protein
MIVPSSAKHRRERRMKEAEGGEEQGEREDM